MHVPVEGSHNRLLRTLGDMSRNDSTFTRPLMMYGEYGCGRFHHILEYILYINYPQYQTFSEVSSESPNKRVSELLTQDIMVAKSPVSISDMRELISESRTGPLELRHRYVIVRDFDLNTKEVQDLFLKTLEDMPPRLYPFITVLDRDRLYDTVESRVVGVPIPSLSEKCLKDICSSVERLKDYLPVLKGYPCFSSVSQPEMFLKLQFASFYEKVFKLQIYEVQGEVDSFLSKVKESDYPVPYVLDFLMRYLTFRLYSEKAEGGYRDALTKTLSNFGKSLTRYLKSPSRDFLLSVGYQLSGLVLSVILLRKVYKIA